MVYAYDQNIQLPVRDLYDTQMMLASIQAAKDMYEKGQQELKDFRKEYGSFYSPSKVDQAYYNKEFNIQGFIKSLYDQGIDPLRSPEGRAAVQQYINTRPYSWYNTAKQTADVGAQYNKALGELDQKGLYNEDMEKNYLKRDLENWDSSKGAWSFYSPAAYYDINTIGEPIVKNLDYSFDEALTKQKNDGNDWYSISKDRIRAAFNDNLNDILSTPSGGYAYWKALKDAGNDKDKARELLLDQFTNRLSDHVKEKKEVNPYKLEAYKSKLDMQEYANKAAIDHKYHELEADSEIDRKYAGQEKTAHRIFREAENNVSVAQRATSRAGGLVTYVPNESYYQFIDPVNDKIARLETKDGHIAYRIPGNEINNRGLLFSVEQLNQSNTKESGVTIKNMDPGTSYIFEQTGSMKAVWDIKAGKYRYFIGGQLIRPGKTKDDPNIPMKNTSRNNDDVYYMEVKERDYNYGEKNR